MDRISEEVSKKSLKIECTALFPKYLKNHILWRKTFQGKVIPYKIQNLTVCNNHFFSHWKLYEHQVNFTYKNLVTICQFSRHIFTGETFTQIFIYESKRENIQIKYKPRISQRYITKIKKLNFGLQYSTLVWQFFKPFVLSLLITQTHLCHFVCKVPSNTIGCPQSLLWGFSPASDSRISVFFK